VDRVAAGVEFGTAGLVLRTDAVSAATLLDQEVQEAVEDMVVAVVARGGAGVAFVMGAARWR
jgi:hypothetical protein